ncbi:nwd1 protein [Colletotrichum kahawae]|uniref:Nwd1 protein n=1 Tax=Colletotrichum kahawae TaxID=34407 RepID=A0AAE0D195_COLKA|nr:nwd1 protein [Colletotrichum kahawae]
MRDLFVTNPEEDKSRIEDLKGGLVEDSYSWILTHPHFQRWYENPGEQVLWIKGHPGTGKTMLMCGIIDHLKSSASYASERLGSFSQVFYFFCEAGDTARNNAEVVLRVLMWSILKAHPSLIPVVKHDYYNKGNNVFTGKNAWYSLSKMIRIILEDNNLNDTIILIDALDECDIGSREKLLGLITDFEQRTSIKWVSSSRNWPSIERKLEQSSRMVILDLELNAGLISEAVASYIRYRVDDMAKGNPLIGMEAWINFKSGLQSRSSSIFLWVATSLLHTTPPAPTVSAALGLSP